MIVRIRNRVAVLVTDSCIVCGNSGYTVTFDWDAEWDGYEERTARFNYRDRRGVLHWIDVPFTGDTCAVPVLRGIDRVDTGLYAGSIRTSTAAKIPCVRCITDDRPPPLCAYDDVYRQLTEILRHIPH